MSSQQADEATGLTCGNCHKPVKSLKQDTFLPGVGWVSKRRAHCDCTLGFYKTNFTRAGLQRACWKGKRT